MRVSIIIPVYNVEPYIKRCVESVIAQKCEFVDIECVLVDDCGTDNSMEIVHQIIADYKGTISFLIVEHFSNRGLSAARNTGLDYSTGDYVMFVDSDDYLVPQCVSYFYKNIENYPLADVVVGNVKCDMREYLFHYDVHAPLLIDDLDVLLSRMLSQQINVCAWNKLVKREVLISNNIRFIEGIIFEDMTWSYFLFSHISSVLLLPQVTYIYDNNPNSITYTLLSLEKVNRALMSYSVSCNILQNNPPDPLRYRCDMSVDYLLFIGNILMRATDLLQYNCTIDNVNLFCAARKRLLFSTLSKGRLLLALFFLFLYFPFSCMKKLRWFRHHHKSMERLICKVSHLTDFLHH